MYNFFFNCKELFITFYYLYGNLEAKFNPQVAFLSEVLFQFYIFGICIKQQNKVKKSIPDYYREIPGDKIVDQLCNRFTL